MKSLKTIGDLKKAIEKLDDDKEISVHGCEYFEIRDHLGWFGIVGHSENEKKWREEGED